MWRGVAIRESFVGGVIPSQTKVVDARTSDLEGEAERGTFDFICVEVDDSDLESVSEFSIKNLRPVWYFHMVGPSHMRVYFNGCQFEFKRDDVDEIKRVVEYGVAEGIHPDQLNIEGIQGLYDDPFG